MNKLEKLLNLGFLLTIVVASCRKVEPVPFQTIDLGKQSTSTSIKSIVQNGTTVTAEFATTPGAKYSVQIIPFGSEEPAKKEGFTAKDSLTVKSYSLVDLPKKHYDFIFIDINGKEVKFPILIK
jgi:hypothetical protein